MLSLFFSKIRERIVMNNSKSVRNFSGEPTKGMERLVKR